MASDAAPPTVGDRYQDLVFRANNVLARGVSSAARLRSKPMIFDGAHGAYVTDMAGRSYIDFVLGMGPMLLGHGNSHVNDAVLKQLSTGVLFGNHPAEIELAERILEVVGYADKIIFANSGSEATHGAIRIARATTGRPLVVKFEGHYHGWIDPLFVNSQGIAPAPAEHLHPAVLTASTGTPTPHDVVVCRWNDIDELRDLFAKYRGEIAAVIMEPLPLNFGTFWPDPGYLPAVRQLCTDAGVLLVFDEVLAGFRVDLAGASNLVGVTPDLGVYAKAVASGFPMALIAGSDAATTSIRAGGLLPAGTYSGGPVAVAAAHATMDVLLERETTLYPRLETLGVRLKAGVECIARDLAVPLAATQIGSVIQLFWGVEMPVRSYAGAMQSDRSAIAEICEGVAAGGCLVSPRGLVLLSTEHDESMIDHLVTALRASTQWWLENTRRGTGAVYA